MVKTLVTLVFVCIAGAVHAQTPVTFELRSGYGAYAMKEFSADLHRQADQNASVLPVKVVSDFPAFYNYGLSILVRDGDFDLGLAYTFASTGGRMHYADYSGEIGLEHLLKLNSLGLTGQYHFYQAKKFNATLTTRLSANFTSSESRVWGGLNQTKPDDQSQQTVSYTFGLTLMPGAEYYIMPWLSVGGRAGYFLDTKGKMFVPGSKRKSTLIDSNGNNIHSDWSGWRAEVFVAFNVTQKDHSKN